MNDTIYNDIIASWIPHLERPICRRKELWLLALRRSVFNPKFSCLMVDIHLHSGSPCIKRYCICRYFSSQDKIHYYMRYFESFTTKKSTLSEIEVRQTRN